MGEGPLRPMLYVRLRVRRGGPAVLAILEGQDPSEAIRRHRALEKAFDRLSDRRVVDVGWDGRRIVVQRYERELAA